jgi:hypothetical protein
MTAQFDASLVWPAHVLPADLASPQDTGTLRWATGGYLSASTDLPADTAWLPRLTGDVEVGQEAADAVGVGGLLSLGLADVELDDADGALADLHRYGTADGRTARITVIPVEDPMQSDYGTPLEGRVIGLEIDLSTGLSVLRSTAPLLAFVGITQAVERTAVGRGVLRITDVVQRLAQPLQPTKYLGTGGVEGGDEVKGKPKPVVLGRVFNIEPVALGNIDLGVGIGSLPTFQCHWREVESIDAVRIRGVAQTLVGGTPVVGQARVFAAQGMVQLGSSPDGPVTMDVRGDAAGGYVSSTAGVMRRLVQSLGPQLGATDIDDLTFAFAEADLPGEVGLYQGAEEATAAELARRLVASQGAILAGGRAGTLRLCDPLAQDADQFSIPDAWVLDIEPLPVPADLRPLPRACAVGWRPNWSPLSDVAGSVAAADRERLRTDQSGPARAQSATITQRVAQQRELTFRGLYWAETDALLRAQKWLEFLAAGPRMFRLTTDRYLQQVECGHIGRIFYPAWGLDGGARCCVVGWREQISARRLSLTVVTLPEA